MVDYIYALRCPIENRIRYIGKSNSPERRLYMHMFTAKRGKYDHHAARWLRKLISQGLTPTLEIIHTLSSEEDWRVVEKHYIAEALTRGDRLVNGSSGGDGVVFIRHEDFEKAKAARTAGFTPDVCASKSASMKKVWADPNRRAVIIAGAKLSASTPERRKQLSEAGRMRTPEGEARRVEAVKAHYARLREEKSAIAAKAETKPGQLTLF